MDRKTWIAIGIAILAFAGWNLYYNATYGDYLEQQTAERIRQAEEAASNPTPPPATPTAGDPVVGAAAPIPFAPTSTMTAQLETVSAGPGADFEFNNDLGGIDTAILLLHLGENQEAVGINSHLPIPIGALAFEPGQPLGGFEMRVDRVRRQAVFTTEQPDGLEITKTFTVSDGKGEIYDGAAAADPDAPKNDPYIVNLEVTFRNVGSAPVERGGYFLSTGGAEPIHVKDLPTYTRFDWSKDGKMENIDVNWFGGSKIPLVGVSLREPTVLYTGSAEEVRWAAVTSQYFCTIITAKGDTVGKMVAAERFAVPNAAGQTIYGMQGSLGMPGFELASGETVSAEFEIYAGPKDLTRLRALGGSQEDVMNFGMFGFVSKFLLWAMNFFHGFLDSYAASIIVLTLCIKTALWPLQNKATQSMKRMALLSPKMTELREKYKDDPTKMNSELMGLYKKYSVNPFSGCLPMLVQIPIFFGFYSMLGSAIELRNSSFFWVHDLSQPDTVGHFAGFPINLLPLLMAGSMVWQMAITPKAGDKNQQRIMMFMPIIFVVFAYNFAAALSLYWTTQNIFSIVQLYLTRNQPLPTLEPKAPAPKPGAAAPKKKKRPKRFLQ
jgi:YidC/Oxa1 family membrane protein insertase